MYTTILRFHVKDKGEFARRIREDLLPRIKGLRGFLGYYGVDGEGDAWGAIVVFKTREEAEAARERVMGSVREAHLDELVEAEPELILTGETVISEMVEHEREERRAA